MAEKHSARIAYERNVGSLSGVVELGLPMEVAARMAVAGRSALKIYHRHPVDDDDLDRFEHRNVAYYGNAISPSADALFNRYRSWALVIEAAARPGGKDLGV